MWPRRKGVMSGDLEPNIFFSFETPFIKATLHLEVKFLLMWSFIHGYHGTEYSLWFYNTQWELTIFLQNPNFHKIFSKIVRYSDVTMDKL